MRKLRFIRITYTVMFLFSVFLYVDIYFSDFLKNLENWSYDIEKYLDMFEPSNNTETIGMFHII